MVGAARWSDENLQNLTDVIPALVSYFDKDHICRFANDYHRYWYGRSAQELVGLHMREFLGPEGYESRLPHLLRVAAGEEVGFDARVPYLNQSERDASIRYVPRITDAGVDGVYVLVFDTTILQRRFHSIFDGTALAFWELDLCSSMELRTARRSVRDVIRATKVVDLNMKAATLFGMNRGQVLGASIADWWPQSSESAFEAVIKALEEGAASLEVETTLRRTDGSLLDVLINCAFPQSEGARSSMVLGIVDLTERNAREGALASLQHELAHVTRVAMLGELTASIAHEVNQPLGAIVNNGNAALRWLNRPQPQIEEVRRSIELLVSEAKRASDIIMRARTLASKGTTERTLVQAMSLIEESVALVYRQVTSLGATMEVEIADDLPPIHADRIQIQQVLVNLIVNAAQAMADQERPAKVRISASVQDGGVCFAVEDNGAGIPEDKLDNLFTAFFTTRESGMGIGLSVSKTIVEAHGGAITASNGVNGGGRFTFFIPGFTEQTYPP
jgi:PAS domain S-box-containing protein